MRSSEIEKVEAVMYRRSEYSDYNSAFKNGGVYCLTETYGYTSTMDSIYNCIQMAEMFKKDSSVNDIRVILVVDGVTLSECYLSEVQSHMHKELRIN